MPLVGTRLKPRGQGAMFVSGFEIGKWPLISVALTPTRQRQGRDEGLDCVWPLCIMTCRSEITWREFINWGLGLWV